MYIAEHHECCVSYQSPHAVVTIGFTETLYTVTENEGSEVVVTAAVLSGPITETVTVHFRPRVANESGNVDLFCRFPTHYYISHFTNKKS